MEERGELMNIVLKSKDYQIIGINKKSTADMFRNLKLGSLVKFEVELKKLEDKRGYATYITATNLNTKESTSKSFNQLPKILEAFELVEYDAYDPLPFEPTETEMFARTE